jgi:hypothetical protein
VIVKTPGSEIEGKVVNISNEGALIISYPASLPRKGSLEMVMKPPERDSLKITGKPVWTTASSTDEGKPCHVLGVQFVDLSETDSIFLGSLSAAFRMGNTEI